MAATLQHIPVLVQEVLQLFDPQPGGTLLDATVGLGGHAAAYMRAANGNGKVVGFDADVKALEHARRALGEYGDAIQLVHQNFTNLKDSIRGGGILLQEFTHVLFDLGIGSHQIADSTRGFSFQGGQGLSMKYGEAGDLPLAKVAALNMLTDRLGYYPDVRDIVGGLVEKDLADVIFFYGEERSSRRIARALKETPLPAEFSAQDLAERIASALPSFYERGRIHGATRTFQALRLAVNRELEALEVALPQAVELLTPGGVVGVISFHSLEDRIVKHYFRAEPALEIITKKPVRASETETQNNPRSRSAKLRVARKKGP